VFLHKRKQYGEEVRNHTDWPVAAKREGKCVYRRVYEAWQAGLEHGFA
jgi:hypothetical protein